MVEKYTISLKVIVLLCLLALCGNSLPQYDKFDCKKLHGKEFTIICDSSSSGNAILPIEQIPNNTRSLVINATSASLAITTANTFQNLKHLQRLLINIKSLYFPENVFNSISKYDLEMRLFSAPKLETFLFKYTEYSDENYAWVLPESLRILHLTNRIFNFDIHSCLNLSSIRLNSNKLSDVPSFENPLTLSELDLRNNPLNKFTVEDIAGLCKLKMYAMDTSDIGSCECKKLKTLILHLQKKGNFIFSGSLSCNDSIGDIDLPKCADSLSSVTHAREKCNIEAAMYRWRRTTRRPTYRPRGSGGSGLGDLGNLVLLILATIVYGVLALMVGFCCKYCCEKCQAIFAPKIPQNRYYGTYRPRPRAVNMEEKLARKKEAQDRANIANNNEKLPMGQTVGGNKNG